MFDIDSLPVTCPVTGERLQRFTKEHAKKLGYPSLTAFRKAHNIDYLTLPQRSRNKLKQLYNIDFTKWVVGYRTSEGVRYVMKQYVEDYDRAREAGLKSASRYPLSDASFNRHFSGENPLAIFAHGTHSRYFGFDVDSKEMAPVHTLKLIKTLEAAGVPRDHIHVSFSGGKGYHIELFTVKHLKFEDWMLIGRYIREKAGLVDESIEFRPTQTNLSAWKLPLTFHPKTGNFAGFCDKDTLEVMGVLQSHDYLYQIEQMDMAPIFAILELAKAHEKEIEEKEQRVKERKKRAEVEKRKAVQVRDVRLFKSDEEKANTAVRLLNEGLPGKGTRWKAMRNVLIPFLKAEQGCTAEQTREILIAWTKREINAGRVGTSYEKCLKEIDELIEDFYPKVEGFYAVVRDIEISRGEIDWVLSVTEKGGTRQARDLLWALLLLKKAYAPKNGQFFASREMLQKLLSKPRKISSTTITKQREWLSSHGFIEYHTPENFYRERKATVYKLSYVEVEKSEIVDSIVFEEDADSRELLKTIASKLYTPKALKTLKVL